MREVFPITLGLHWQSVLSPYLYVLVMDELTRHMQQEIPWCMLFIGNSVLVDETKQEIISKLKGGEKFQNLEDLELVRIKMNI